MNMFNLNSTNSYISEAKPTHIIKKIITRKIQK